MLFSALRFDIGAHLIKRCAAYAADIVSPMPELRLAIERGQMLGKTVSCPSRAGRFEIVDQHRNVKCRMDINQQMHMIGLAAELKQLATPSDKAFGKGILEVFKQFRRERFAAILCYKNNV